MPSPDYQSIWFISDVNEKRTNNTWPVIADTTPPTLNAYAWWSGYQSNPGTVSATIQRLNYVADYAGAVIRAPGILAAAFKGAVYTPNYGYWGGGSSNTMMFSTIEKLVFAADTSSISLSASLFAPRNSLTGLTNHTNGYFIGGKDDILSVIYNQIERIVFSSETLSVTASMSQPLRSMVGVGDTTYGWLAGGTTVFGNGAGYTSNINRFDYSNDVASPVFRSNLITGKHGLAAVTDSIHNWFAGGQGSSYYSTIDRTTIANDLIDAAFRSNLSLARRVLNGGVTNGIYGWFGGGISSPTASQQIIDRLDYANDTVNALIRSTMIDYCSGVTGVGNSPAVY